MPFQVAYYCKQIHENVCVQRQNLAILRLIIEFIIEVYYPIWFEVKVKHNFIEDPKLLLKMLELVWLQKNKVQEIVAPHIARSAW